jgi:hypothetical protein
MSDLILIENVLAADVAEGLELDTLGLYLDQLENEYRKAPAPPRLRLLVRQAGLTLEAARGLNDVARGHCVIAHAAVAKRRLG